MALIVETGAIIAGANSYVAQADADAYFALSNNSTWDGYDASDQKIPYLILAARFMQQTYRRRWQGYRFSVNQVLDWPRYNVQQFDVAGGYGPFPRYYDPNTVPQEIKDAQCELALRVGNGDLNPDVSPEDMASMTKVGPISISYRDNAPATTVFLAVELLLKPFFASSGINSMILRS